MRKPFVTLVAGALVATSLAVVQAAQTGTTNTSPSAAGQKASSTSAGQQKAPAVGPEANTQAKSEETAKSQGQPVKEKQFVYSLSPWTGKEYGGTFAPRQINTMYLMAGVDNIVNSLKTEVYYWPITSEYMADWFGYKEEVPGTLQILQDGKVIRSLQKTDYVYVFPDGAYGSDVKLVTGAAAQTEFKRYEKMMDDYWNAVNRYYEEDAAYRRKMDALLQRVMRTKVPAKPSEIPKAPKQPEPPKLYVTQPVKAFLVNLPAGRYQVQLLDSKGQIVPDSKKNLVVFSARREGIGYEILPESKWTRPVNSDDITQILYMEGKRVFYVKPFQEQEFNVYEYAKMSKLHAPLEGEGTRSSWGWVHGQEIKGGKLQILRNGQVIQEIPYKGYYVQQTPGYALGYSIVEFDPKAPGMEGRQPSFSAFRVELDASGSYELRYVDANGQVQPASIRQIRPVRGTLLWPMYLIALFPLVLGGAVFAWRQSLRPSRRLAGELAGEAVAATREAGS